MKTLISLLLLLFLLHELRGQEFTFTREVIITEKDLGNLGFYPLNVGQDTQMRFITDAQHQQIIFMGMIDNNEIVTLHITPASQYEYDFKDLRYEDTNHDGKMELYVLQESVGLIRLDTATLEGLDTIVTFPVSVLFKKMILADIDHDLINEWVMLDANKGVSVFELTTFTETWNAPLLKGRDMLIGNLDDDPALELVLLASTGIRIVNIETLEEEHFLPSAFYTEMDLIDLNLDGKEELILIRGNIMEIYDHETKMIIDDFTTGNTHYDGRYYRNIDEDPNLEIILYQRTFKSFLEINTFPLTLRESYTLDDHVILGRYVGATSVDPDKLLFLPDQGISIYEVATRKVQTTTITGPPSGILTAHFENYPHEVILSHPVENNYAYITFKSLPDFKTIKTLYNNYLFEGSTLGFATSVDKFRVKGLLSNQLLINRALDFSLYNPTDDSHQEFFDLKGNKHLVDDLDFDGGDELINYHNNRIHVYQQTSPGKFILQFSTPPTENSVQLRTGQLNQTKEKEIIAFNAYTINVYSGLNGLLLREVTGIPDGIIQDMFIYTDNGGDFYIAIMHSATFYIYNYTKDIVTHTFTFNGHINGRSSILQILEGGIIKNYILIHNKHLQIYTPEGDIVFLEDIQSGSGTVTGNIMITDYDVDFHPNIILTSGSKFTEYEYSGAGVSVESFYPTNIFPKDSIVLNHPTSYILQFSERVLPQSIPENIFILSKKQGNVPFTIEWIGDFQIKLTHNTLLHDSDIVTLVMRGGLQSIGHSFLDTDYNGISLRNQEPIILAVYIYESTFPGSMLMVSPLQNLPEYLYSGSRRHLSFQISTVAPSDIPIAYLHYGILSTVNQDLDSLLPIDKSFDEPIEEFAIPVPTFKLATGYHTLFFVAGDFAGNISDTFFYPFQVVSEQGYYDKNTGGDAVRSQYLLNKLITPYLKKIHFIPHLPSEKISHIVGGDGFLYYIITRIQEDSIIVRKINLSDFQTVWEQKLSRYSTKNSIHLSDGYLYFINNYNTYNEFRLLAYDIITGERIWEEPFYSVLSVQTSPITDREHLLITGGDYGGTYCLNRWTGQKNWYSKRLNTNYEIGIPALYKNSAYLVENTTIKSVDLASGKTNWEIDINEEPSYLLQRNALVDTLYHQFIWAGKNNLYAFDLETGILKWRIPGSNSIKNPALFQNYIFLFKSNSVHVHNAATGKFIRQQQLSSSIIGQPVASNGKLFIPLSERFEILDMSTLRTIWTAPFAVQEISIIDQYLLLTDTGEDIHVYESSDLCCTAATKWTEVQFSGFQGEAFSRKYTFDSIPVYLNGNSYNEILYSDLENDENWQKTEILVRHADNKIYKGLASEEIILFDFNLSINDVFTSGTGIEYVVTAIDSIVLENGEIRKRLEVHCEVWGDIPVYWIEGFGSTAGLANYDNICAFDAGSALLCLWHEENLLYNHPDYNTCWLNIVSNKDIKETHISLHPNPVTDVLIINDPDQNIKSIFLHDLLGNLVHSGTDLEIEVNGFPSGCYFIHFVLTNGHTVNQRIIKQ